MKLSNLFKPKWQHESADVRRAALEKLSGDERTTVLRHMAENDADANLRSKALFELKDPQLLIKARREKNLAEKAGSALLELAVAPGGEALLADLDSALLTRLLKQGQPAELLPAALAQIDDEKLPQLLPELRDPTLWKAGLARISKEDTLAALGRSKHKDLAAAAAEKLLAAQLARGEPNAVSARAITLSSQLETLSRSRDLFNKKPEAAALRSEWNQLVNPDAKLVERFDRAERVFNKLAADQDPAVLAERAASLEEQKAKRDELAQQYEQLLEATPAKRPAKAQTDHVTQAAEMLEKQWHEFAVLPAEIGGALNERFEKAKALLQQRVADWSSQANRSELRKSLLKDINALQKNLGVNDESKLKALKKNWAAVAADAPNEQQEKIAQQFDSLQRKVQSLRKEGEAWVSKIPDTLSQLENQIENSELAGAGKVWNELQRVIKLAAPLTDGQTAAGWQNRMTKLAPHMRELRDWQQWSTIEERKRINNELESLVATDSSGDNLDVLEALSNKMAELQRVWKSLGAARSREEKDQDSRHEDAVKALRKRAEPFFAARRAVRNEKINELKGLGSKLSEMTAVATSSTDWKALEHGLRDAKRAMSKLNDLPQRDRGGLAKVLRSAIQPAEDKLKDQQSRFAGRKQKLLEEAESLIEQPDLDAAINRIKGIQAEWKTAGNSDRKTEQQLWDKLRAAADAVFDRKNAARNEERAALQSELKDRETLVAKIEQLAGEIADNSEVQVELTKLRSEFDQLLTQDAEAEQAAEPKEDPRARDGQWDERPSRPRRAPPSPKRKAMDALERRVEKADELLTQNKKAAKSAAEGQQISQLQALAAAMDQAETSGDAIADERWAELIENLPASWVKPMEQRRSRGTAEQEQEAERGELLCLDLEIAAGVDSPANVQQARLDRQVNRLNAAFGGDEAKASNPAKLQRNWYSVGPLADAQRKVLATRAKSAIDTFK